MFKKSKKDWQKPWKILWKYLSVYKRDLTLLSILGVFSALASGAVPYVTGKFLDSILDSRIVFEGTIFAMQLWVLCLLAWGFVTIVSVGGGWVNDRWSRKISFKFFTDYRAYAPKVLLSLPLSFHKDVKIGHVIDLFYRASHAFENITGNIIINLAPEFLSIGIGIGFAFFMNWKLALVLLLGILLYIFALLRITPSMGPLQERMDQAYKEGHQAMNQATTNVLLVKQFGNEEYHGQKMQEGYDCAYKEDIALNNIWVNIGFLQRVIVVVTQVIIFVSSVYLIQGGSMTIGELLAFNGYAALVFGPFVTMGRNWQMVKNGLVSIIAAEKIITQKPEDYSPRGAIKDFDFQGAIKFSNVTFSYKKDQKVLDGISFETKPGEMIALVGESGAGKSTLIDLISGYYFPSSGRVTIDGHLTRKLDLRFLRKNIAVVPQEVALFHESIKTNIKYGSFDATEEEIINAAKVAHADTFIEQFPKKYETVVGERGVKLSVGQKQRIAIARAILRDPKILILDEPTSALDSETEKYVTEALDKVMKGRTTFVIAHRLSTVRKADKILVLEKGKIVEQGTHDELMAIEGGNYRRRYELHVGLV